MRVVAWAFFVIIIGLSTMKADAARDACSLITKAAVQQVLHWSVSSVSNEPYRVQLSTGTVCTYDAKDGSVIVTLPDSGSSFLGTNPLVEPQAMGQMVSVNGVGDSARIFDGTIYVEKHQRSFAIKVVPDNGYTSNDQLVKLAKIAAARLR